MCFVDGYGEIVGLVIRAGMGVCLPFGYDSGGESGAGNRVFRSGRGRRKAPKAFANGAGGNGTRRNNEILTA